MKKKFLLFTLLLSALAVQAQIALPTMFVAAKDGSASKDYMLRDIQKITFSDGNMVISVKSGAYSEAGSYPLVDIEKIYFDFKTYGIVQEEAQDFFLWSPFTGDLTVHCTPGTAIRIYSSNGQQALTTIQTIAQSPVNLSVLPRGLYIIEVAGKTLKIVR